MNQSNNLPYLTAAGIAALGIVIFIFLITTSRVKIDGGEEAVFIYQPIFPWSTDGVSPTPGTAGSVWKVRSTKHQIYDIKPVRLKEPFADLTASDNVAVDFDTYVTLQIMEGQTPKLHQLSGEFWYKNKVQDTVRSIIRNLARTKTSIELRTNETVISNMQETIKLDLAKYISSIDLPVRVVRVNIGKVIPPDEVLTESAKTAAEKQKIQTQEQRELAEKARKAAEKAAAEADLAYSNEFNMSTDQFLRNKQLDIMSQAIVSGADVSILVNSADAIPVTKLGK